MTEKKIKPVSPDLPGRDDKKTPAAAPADSAGSPPGTAAVSAPQEYGPAGPAASQPKPAAKVWVRGPYKKKNKKPSPKPAAAEEIARVKGKTLAGTLKVLHELAAKLPGLEALELDANESKLLADALREFSEAYPSVKVSPKLAVWFTLISTLGVIYGPRFILIRMQFEMRRAKARATSKPPAQVIPLKPQAAAEPPASVSVPLESRPVTAAKPLPPELNIPAGPDELEDGS